MNSDAPRVSVIMIFRDAAPYIAEAIESVLSQTFTQWELILVDDAATDGSSKIAKNYARRYPDRIRYTHHQHRENRGMSTSRNLGIRESCGSLIAFLDADDFYLPEKLQRQVTLIDAHPTAAMVYGATTHWYSWTGTQEVVQRDFKRKLGVIPNSLIPHPEMVRLFLSHAAWPPGTCGVLVRRSAVDSVGQFESRFKGMFEDQAFFYKLCLFHPVFVEDGSWDLYRQHSKSWTESMRKSGQWRPGRHEKNPAKEDFLRWLQTYIDEHGIDDGDVRRLLREALRPYQHPLLYAFVARCRRLLRPVVVAIRQGVRSVPERR